MKKIVMYYHVGSKNHGCEAIVRSTAKILGQKLELYSSEVEEDKAYKLDEIVETKEDVAAPIRRNSWAFFSAAVSHKICKNDYKYITLSHKAFFDNVKSDNIYLSIGGDNYCYKGRDILGYYNKCLHKKRAKTVLWGCSFEPQDMTPEIAKDLALYDLIVAREKISYESLKAVNAKTVLLPDPAFQLDFQLLPLPEGFSEDNTVGINLSPLISEYADKEIILGNYKNLIRYIIKNSDSQIALIPHVVKEGNDDREVLEKLYSQFKNTGRVVLMDDYNCMQLKGFISRCRMFIGARTHATIAAYSTCVPTLVVGYSIKAIGIARELFGTDENYVVPVQRFTTEDDLTNAFIWIKEREKEIRNHLIRIMPEYKARILEAKKMIEEL